MSSGKSLAVWNILRDGPFRATAGGVMGYSNGEYYSAGRDETATWLLNGNQSHITFSLHNNNPTTSVSFHIDALPSYIVSLNGVDVTFYPTASGGSIRLIRE